MKTIIFEVSDNINGKADLSTSSYDRLFCEFLATLNLPDFEYKVGYNFCEVFIDGITFSVETKNCTYWARNAWTRKTEKRKDENRFAVLGFSWDLLDGKYTVKVHINKEIDGDKLKAKILKAVEGRKLYTSEIESKRKHEENVLDSLCVMFKSSTVFIHKYVTNIHFHKGSITFIVNDIVYIKFNTNFGFLDFSIRSSTTNITDFNTILDKLKEIDIQIKGVIKEVQENNVLTQEQRVAVNNAYETSIKL